MILLPLSILFQSLLIRVRPFETPSDNLISLFNELSVSIYLYLSLLLTDSAIDISLRPYVGDVLGYFVIFVVSVNLIKALAIFVSDFRLAVKRMILKR
jgi:hypothetical protein